MNNKKHEWKFNALLVITAAATLNLIGCNNNQTTLNTNDTSQKAEFSPIQCQQFDLSPQSINALENLKPRPWAQSMAMYEGLAVEHPQTYMSYQCPPLSQDYQGNFETWSKNDVRALLVNPIAFLGQVIYLPVELAQTPPWKIQASRDIYPKTEPQFDFSTPAQTPKEKITTEGQLN